MLPRPDLRGMAAKIRRKQATTLEQMIEDSDLSIPARELTIAALNLTVALHFNVSLAGFRDMAELVGYTDWAIEHGARWKNRRRIMDIDLLVAQWADSIIALSTGHDPDTRADTEARTDELLTPLLIAPVAQVREFAQKLSAVLEADRRVPFLVWSGFKRVVMPLILKGPESEALALKTALATEIAELVEHDLPRADLIAAIAGALQWRAADTLEKVKTQLQAGQTPRMIGKESCLFLSVGKGPDAAFVML